MLYPQNGDRIVAIDSVTSLHLMYRVVSLEIYLENFRKFSPNIKFPENLQPYLQVAVVGTDDNVAELLSLPVVVHEVEDALGTGHVDGVVLRPRAVSVAQHRRQRVAIRRRVNRIHRHSARRCRVRLVPMTSQSGSQKGALLSRDMQRKLAIPCDDDKRTKDSISPVSVLLF